MKEGVFGLWCGLLDVYPLVDLAVGFGDEMSCRVLESICDGGEEKVALQNLVGLGKFLLGFLEIKVDIEGLDEVGDGVVVLVALLSHDADEVLELLLVGTLAVLADGTVSVGDDSGGEIAKDPGAGGLDGVDVGWGEEEFGQSLAGGLVVEEGVERPVDEPGAVFELGKRVGKESGVDVLTDLLDLLHGVLPLLGQDVGGKLTPSGGGDFVVVGALRRGVGVRGG